MADRDIHIPVDALRQRFRSHLPKYGSLWKSMAPSSAPVPVNSLANDRIIKSDTEHKTVQKQREPLSLLPAIENRETVTLRVNNCADTDCFGDDDCKGCAPPILEIEERGSSNDSPNSCHIVGIDSGIDTDANFDIETDTNADVDVAVPTMPVPPAIEMEFISLPSTACSSASPSSASSDSSFECTFADLSHIYQEDERVDTSGASDLQVEMPPSYGSFRDTAAIDDSSSVEGSAHRATTCSDEEESQDDYSSVSSGGDTVLAARKTPHKNDSILPHSARFPASSSQSDSSSSPSISTSESEHMSFDFSRNWQETELETKDHIIETNPCATIVPYVTSKHPQQQHPIKLFSLEGPSYRNPTSPTHSIVSQTKSPDSYDGSSPSSIHSHGYSDVKTVLLPFGSLGISNEDDTVKSPVHATDRGTSNSKDDPIKFPPQSMQQINNEAAAPTIDLVRVDSTQNNADSNSPSEASRVDTSQKKKELDRNSFLKNLTSRQFEIKRVPPARNNSLIIGDGVSDESSEQEWEGKENDSGSDSDERKVPRCSPKKEWQVIILSDSDEEEDSSSGEEWSKVDICDESSGELEYRDNALWNRNEYGRHNRKSPPKRPSTKPLKRSKRPPNKSSGELLSSPVIPRKSNKPLSKAAFKRTRDALTAETYENFNHCAFGKRLTDVQVSWSPHLRTTAGLTRLKKITQPGHHPQRTATIELSKKIIDDPHRLRSTLLHEMCHAAAWLVDGVSKPPHGSCFKKWAKLAMNNVRTIR